MEAPPPEEVATFGMLLPLSVATFRRPATVGLLPLGTTLPALSSHTTKFNPLPDRAPFPTRITLKEGSRELFDGAISS